MKKLFAIVVLLLCICPLTKSQNEKDSTLHYRGVHSFGFAAGVTTGVGLSYRYIPGKLGIQTTFAPLFINEHNTAISLGFSFLYNLAKTEKVNFYMYQGNHFLTDVDSEFTMFNGLGIGIELIFWKNIGYDLMVGYGLFDTFKEVSITGETGFFFLF